MKKITLLSVLLLFGVGAIIISGCNSSGPNEILGDPNDPEFQFVDEIVAEQALVNVGKMLEISFMFYDSIPGVSQSAKFGNTGQAMDDEQMVVDSFNYAFGNGWHSFDFWLKVIDTVSNDTLVITGSDSIRAQSNGQWMQTPDSTVDELNIRCHYTFDLVTATFTGAADYTLDLTNFTGDLMDPITINATGSETLNGLEADSQVSCDFSLSNSLAASDVLVAFEGTSGCPTGGTLDLTSTVDISCSGQIGASVDTVDIQGEWNIFAQYKNDGSVDVAYTDGTTIWQATIECDSPPASPVTRWNPNLD